MLRLDEQCDHDIAQLEHRHALLQQRMDDLKLRVSKLQQQMDAMDFWYHEKNLNFKYSLKEKDGICEYTDLEQIGRVNYGSVYRARKDSQTVAIKRLQKSDHDTVELIESLNREIEILTELPHPNVIPLLNVIHAADHVYMVFKLAWKDVHYINRNAVLKRHERYEFMSEIMAGVLQALVHLHQTGYAHCDLKPENILLDHPNEMKSGLIRNHVKLCDFGFAQPVGETIRGSIFGTPGFFGPEMMSWGEFEGRSADMWSVGACLLELTVGFPDDWVRLYSKCRQYPHEFASGINRCLENMDDNFFDDVHLQNLIMDHLFVQPQDRSTAQQVLEHPWFGSGSTE